MNKKVKNARQMLLKEGEVVLINKGYANLNISELTNSCGMATGTFYGYFKNKKDLAVTILKNAWEAALESAEKSAFENDSAHDRLKAIYDCVDRFNNTYNMIFMQIATDFQASEYVSIRQSGLAMLYGVIKKILEDEVERGSEIHVDLEKLSIIIGMNLFMISREERISFDNFFDSIGVWAKACDE